MALADYGKKTELLEDFKSVFNISPQGIKVNHRIKQISLLKIEEFKKEDVAFALQSSVEDTVSSFVCGLIEDRSKPDLFLAGGLFANIKVNQNLHETGAFNRVFVSPNMGDGGMSFMAAHINHTGKTCPLKNVYLGIDYADDYIERVLKEKRISYIEEPDIEKKSAFLLAQGKTLARFGGRMEYGPRALGNRSILYQTTDKSVNDWLNKKLHRSEFMPFAPVTLHEYADQCYLNLKKAEYAAKFMTISFNCTEWMKKISPGVVHIDGTARPQILSEEDNPGYYKILKEYHKITGIPSLINTSFNMHEEPIVCSPEDALKAFKASGIDYLAMGDYLIRQ